MFGLNKNIVFVYLEQLCSQYCLYEVSLYLSFYQTQHADSLQIHFARKDNGCKRVRFHIETLPEVILESLGES